jgi:dienelactone hydrolase
MEDKSPYWRVEHVSFRAAYGDERERVSAHLYVPRNSIPPFQVVAFMGGSDILSRSRYEDRDVPHNFEFIIRSGRALIAPAYSGTLERGPSAYYHRSGEPQRWQEMNLKWSKDLGRSIDYLETRRDIDIGKLAYFGVSLGAATAVRLVAVEPRFKAAILLSGGSYERMPPAVDPWNFAPRFTTPVLMLNGRDDFQFPLETSQIPLYRQLGTLENNKKHWLIEGGHATPVTRLDMVKQALDWLDRYLGPVSTRP